MTNDAPFIRIDNVVKTFGDTRAVDGVSLEIGQGELFCLLGGSGCGKTTLLRMLAGFEQPDAGRIFIGDQDVTDLDPTQRPVNMMFQSYALFPHMSVAKNIEYGLVREGMAKAERDERVAEMLRLVRLEEFGGRKPDQLSGGQRQRVALARALAKRPKVLLLDEPLAALDKKLRQETQYELINIQETLGTTFVVVTHDQEEAMTLATRIGVMNDGKLVQVDEPKALYEQPNNRFIADFLGAVSFIDGKIDDVSKDGLVSVSTQLGAISVKADSHTPYTTGQDVSISLRPERLNLTKTTPEGADNVISGEVEEMAFLGNHFDFRIRTQADVLLKVVQSTHNRRTETITWQDQVYISFDASDGLLLME